VLVEVDSGGHRTGVASPGEAVRVATAAARAGLVVDGVFTHGGHSYRQGAAGAAGLDEVTSLEAMAAALEAAGFEVRIVSAGSTPTRTLAASGRVTEIRAGTYVFGDRQQVAIGAIDPDEVAAVVATTVVSTAAGRAVIDAGAKTLTKDLPDTVEGYGAVPAWPGAIIERLNDYHGMVSLPGGGLAPSRGAVVAVVPNHICPVVDLVSTFAAIQTDGRVEHWPVDARGRSG
jgi:D-serine deaminase-like pyridoxal phosphate-dependent protein